MIRGALIRVCTLEREKTCTALLGQETELWGEAKGERGRESVGDRGREDCG